MYAKGYGLGERRIFAYKGERGSDKSACFGYKERMLKILEVCSHVQRVFSCITNLHVESQTN